MSDNRFMFKVEGRSFDHRILGEVSVSFAEGETLCLLGSSGCGKTTLLNIIAGLDDGYNAPVWSGDEPELGYLFQQPRLLPWRTVLDNLLLVNPDVEQALSLLKEVGLESAANQYPTRLSLGMARRVALVRCLLLSPDLILMDEPLVSLDPHTARQMRGLIERLIISNPNRHMLYVTHDLDEALQIADRILVLGGNPAHIVASFKRDEADKEQLEQALYAESQEVVKPLKQGSF